MCCRRRRNAPNGVRYYPAQLVVVLGKLAYDNYQERKARKVAAGAQSLELPGEELGSSPANGVMSEKADINPPTYNELVVNRAIVP